MLLQVRFKSCVRFLQISTIEFKSAIFRFGISARLPESEILPDSSSKPDSHKLPESMCQDQIHDFCPIRSVCARFSTLARFKISRIRFDFFFQIRSAVTAASAAMTEASLALLAGDTGYWGFRLGSP